MYEFFTFICFIARLFCVPFDLCRLAASLGACVSLSSLHCYNTICEQCHSHYVLLNSCICSTIHFISFSAHRMCCCILPIIFLRVRHFGPGRNGILHFIVIINARVNHIYHAYRRHCVRRGRYPQPHSIRKVLCVCFFSCAVGRLVHHAVYAINSFHSCLRILMHRHHGEVKGILNGSERMTKIA